MLNVFEKILCPNANLKSPSARPGRITMNNDELLIKARRKLAAMPLSKIGMESQGFTESSMVAAPTVVIVHFGCKTRSDTYQLALDQETGRQILSMDDLNPARGKVSRLSDHELLEKAQRLLDSWLRHPLFRTGTEPEEYTETKILKAPVSMIRFGSKTREDLVDLVVNVDTGDCVTATHSPKRPSRKDS
jgi:hypothetical protein